MTSHARWVENRDVGRGGDPALLPDRACLEEARGLVARHGIVPCTLARVTIADRPVWLALESMQTTGSFKVRGALMAMEALLKRGSGGRLAIVTASAGNHGAGVAFAAKRLGADATVVVPKTAARTKVAKIAGYGATVIEASAPGYDGAEREAMELAAARGLPFLSAFDDVDVVAGNGGSLGFDIARGLGALPAEVICPVGGGGVATGLACAFAHLGASQSPVVGVQIEQSPAFAMSLEEGRAVTELPPAITLAEGLEGGLPPRAFARLRQTVRGALVVDEAMIAAAMRYAVRELGLVLEGSAAAALAAFVHDPRPAPSSSSGTSGERVVVLTGRNVDRERLAELC